MEQEQQVKKPLAPLSANNITVPEVYSELFNFKSDYKRFILSSGRISGKTSVLVGLWWVYSNKYPDNDIVILQATATEIKDSIINEIYKFLANSGFDVGDDPQQTYYIPKAHDQIVINDGRHKGKTYFYPITDSNGGQRSRGVATQNKICLVLYEEAQKNKDANVVEQSMATFIRQLVPGGKIVVVGNSETLGHWFVDYVEEKRKSNKWKYIYANCFDIWTLLGDETKEFILDFKKTNPIEFRRIYLGDVKASTSDVVFPQFINNKENCYKLAKNLETKYIRTLIIGVDHATANDTFAIVPVAVLDDGTTQTLEVCYDDPSETQQTLAPTEQCELLKDFVNFLDKKYGIAQNQLRTILSVDGAASPFIAQLKHLKNTVRTYEEKRLWKQIQIKGFTAKKKDINLGIIKNAFAYGVLVILNEGYYMWDGTTRNTHRLAHEIEAQRYKNGKLDPKIKNDLCDALEYGLIPYYTNCYNMSFPVRQQDLKKNHYNDIRKVAGVK